MKKWLLIVTISVPTCVAIVSAFVLVLLFFRRRSCSLGSHKVNSSIEATSISSGIVKLHRSYKAAAAASGKNNHHRFHHLHQSQSIKDRSKDDVDPFHLAPHQKDAVFHWKNNPNLLSEAVQEGWCRFRFSSLVDSSSDGKMLMDPEETAGSEDLMQVVRLNPGTTSKNSQKKKRRKKKKGPFCVWMMEFPLPGPVTEDTYFPQDSYFEITIMYLQCCRIHKKKGAAGEGDKVKLFRQQDHTKFPPEAEKEDSPMQKEELDDGNDENNNCDYDEFVSLGLTRGGTFASEKKPGSYPGSICFDSDGSVHLQGR